MAAPPLSDAEMRFLKELGDRNVRFMIVGLAAAALQGAPLVTQDVDLWFEDLNDFRIRDALREVGAAYVAPTAQSPPMFAGGGIELFDIVMTMDGLSGFPEEIHESIEMSIDGVRLKVLHLNRILASKRAANRPKDRLEDTLRARGARDPAAEDI